MHLGCRSAAPRAWALPVPLSGVGFLKYAHRVRRGERGVEWMGGPLWSPAMPLPKKTYFCKLTGHPVWGDRYPRLYHTRLAISVVYGQAVCPRGVLSE